MHIYIYVYISTYDSSGLHFGFRGEHLSVLFFRSPELESSFCKKSGMSSCPGLAMVGGLYPRQHV